MAKPEIAQKKPYVMEMQAGTYAWCACGKSKNQPFCDGSHTGSKFSPVIQKIEAPTKVAWCGCKHTKTPPFCDGSHMKL
ncbi:MAG: CDGSH iron-sulfur domain-containing protein [Bacteroidales bacterium]|nr:CDGSH iron-sulfur domain-containing protein [Bacteroidales bacterium]